LKVHIIKPIILGKLPKVISNHYNLNCDSNNVMVFPGAIKHIEKRHPQDLEKYFNKIEEIISNPDYVGQKPKEPKSVELIKEFEDDVLVAIKLDPSGYIYLSTMYSLQNAKFKIKTRLKSGRLISYTDLLANLKKK